MIKGIALGTALLLATGSAPAAEGREEVKPSREREFTLGLVQKEIRIGMSQADLVSALGSPNILTRDSQGRESWVYDKIATEVRVKSTGFGGGAGGLETGGSAVLFGLLNGHTRSERAESSQRTLTVVIRFDGAGRVESFAFHASRF
ncbi:MAG TPA: hypothetical protein VFM88_21670 [Vicinamibacteria bacterium]|nr:hypothetical protein [Vicinamibacteria bacterium]